MKCFVYKPKNGNTVVFSTEQPTFLNFLGSIEAKVTVDPITENFAGIFIEIGEVFYCNGIESKLKRIA